MVLFTPLHLYQGPQVESCYVAVFPVCAFIVWCDHLCVHHIDFKQTTVCDALHRPSATIKDHRR